MAKIDNAFTKPSSGSNAVDGLAENLINSAVGSVSPLNDFGRYMSGARAIIKVNDVLFGFAFGVNFNINTDVSEIWTIDDWTPYELAPSKITVSGTLSMFHVPGKGPTKQLVQANVLSFLMHKYITLEISDQTTGQIIFKTNRAIITSKNQSLQAGELSTIQLSWKAIGWIDEMTPAFPDGASETEGGAQPGILGQISGIFG